jgi:hypothetical protein
MKRSEYIVHLAEAMAAGDIKSQLGTVIKGDQMSAVTMHLPLSVLRAVVNNQVMFDSDVASTNNEKAMVAFHHGWIEACNDELADRILTGNADEREESQTKTST